LRKAAEEPTAQDATRLTLIALHAGLQGDHELAAAVASHGAAFGSSMDYVLWWPSLKGARQTPTWKQLMRDLGMYDYWRQSGNWGDFARPVGDDDFQIVG